MKLRLLVFTCLVPLTACSAWDNYVHPEMALPEKWQEPQGKQCVAPPDKEWWKHFNSPELNALIDETGSANFDIQAAAARVAQADAQARIAGSSLFPSVDLGGDAVRNRNQRGGGRTVTTTTGTGTTTTSGNTRSLFTNSYNTTLNASYELDFWGKYWSQAESARALADASRFDKQTVILTTNASVADTYFDIIATRDRLAVAQKNLSNANDLLGAIRKRYQQGILNGLDLAQQQTLTAQQQASIPPLELHLRQQLDALAILLGKLPESMQDHPGSLDDIAAPYVNPGIPSELLTRRPDVQFAESNLISAHANIINARAAFFPDIALTANGGFASAAFNSLFKSGSFFYSYGASLAQPIFEGGALTGALDLNKARYDELLQDYKKSVVSAFSDTEDALAAVKRNYEEMKAQEVAAQAARTAYTLSERQLKGGIVDITSVLDVQRALFQSEDTMIQAKLAYLQSIVGLYRALGGGWEGKATQP